MMTEPLIAEFIARLPGLYERLIPKLRGVSDTTIPIYNANATINHDVIKAGITGGLLLPGNATAADWLVQGRRLYIDCYLFGVDGRVVDGVPYRNNGTPAEAYLLSEGLSLDWSLNGHAASRDALFTVRDHTRNCVRPGIIGLESEENSRQVAYAITTLVESDRHGLAWDQAVIDERIDQALMHIDQWLDPDMGWAVYVPGRPGYDYDPIARVYPFIQPWMMGLTGYSLALYLDYIEGRKRTTDARIVPAIEALCTWLWTHAWQRNGHTGCFPTRYHVDPEFVGSDPNDPDNDWSSSYSRFLGMELVYPFNWLAVRTGQAHWRDKAATIWNESLAASDDEFNAPKQLNEFVRYANENIALFNTPLSRPRSAGLLRLQTGSGLLRIGVASA